jgi:hypothetical protein
MPTVLQFEPRLMKLLLLPHETESKRVVVRYTSSDVADPWKAAQRLRARLHQLRAAMKRESHTAYGKASKVHVGAKRLDQQTAEVTIRLIDEDLLGPVERALEKPAA